MFLLLLFCLYWNSSNAQAGGQDTTLNFNERVKLNVAATGQDTSNINFVNSPQPDTAQKITRTELKQRSGGRRFYWNESRYPTNDSSLAAKKLRRHSPLYAALFSAACPGLGQAYNRKYWKIPIVYAGLGGLGYACYYTASNFYGYRNAYRAQVATVPDITASYKGIDDPATLKVYRDSFKKSLDISAICTGVWYVLNIVDAAVDAHLFEWNMKDDIHLSWQPTMVNNASYASSAPGIRLNLNF